MLPFGRWCCYLTLSYGNAHIIAAAAKLCKHSNNDDDDGAAGDDNALTFIC